MKALVLMLEALRMEIRASQRRQIEDTADANYYEKKADDLALSALNHAATREG